MRCGVSSAGGGGPMPCAVAAAGGGERASPGHGGGGAHDLGGVHGDVDANLGGGASTLGGGGGISDDDGEDIRTDPIRCGGGGISGCRGVRPAV